MMSERYAVSASHLVFQSVALLGLIENSAPNSSERERHEKVLKSLKESAPMCLGEV